MKTLVKKSDLAKKVTTQKIVIRLANEQVLRLAAIIRDYQINIEGSPEASALILDLNNTEFGDVITRVRTDWD